MRMRLDHVQVSCPAGAEGVLRDFYGGLLGMTELPKPPVLAAQGGAWFRADGGADGGVEGGTEGGTEGGAAGGAEVHVGVEADFRPARKAHPAFAVADVEALARRLAGAGHEVRWDEGIPGVRRFHTDDPVGNRLEFVQE